MSSFLFATATALQNLISYRDGETKLGEKVQTINSWEDLHRSPAKYVLLGIPEDIGIRANLGIGGAHTAWEAALKSVLNIQSTDRFAGNELIVAGAFNFPELMAEAENAPVARLRELTALVDETVAPVVQQIVAAGKIPVIIGGGHNNAYPILMGSAAAKGAAVNAINLDAHSDYRRAEGRHSGNGFRYARMNGWLDKYAVVGLHENYNSNTIVKELMADAALHCSTYEDIFLREKESFAHAVTRALQHVGGKPFGIELDVDCIAGVLSSAATPGGITTLDARKYITLAAGNSAVCYLHITEGATRLRDGRHDAQIAKLIAYLVSDFVKANKA